MTKTCVIVGGGLAGLAAAIKLGDAGWKVTLLESRRRLGGRASSFVDASSGLEMDNCQHVLMGCCTNLIHFYKSLGVSDAITWHDKTWWLRPKGGMDCLQSTCLPAPLHFAPSFLRMRSLTRKVRQDIQRAMWRTMRMGSSETETWRGHSFASLLDEWKQGDDTRSNFWTPLIVSALNLPLHEASAVFGLQVLRDGFLASAKGARIGVPSVSLADLYKPSAALIERSGGEVRLGSPVTGIEVEDRCAVGVRIHDELICGDAVLSALPWEKLDALMGNEKASMDTRLHQLSELGHSPILGAHVLLDRPVLHVPHLVMPNRNVQWLFDKGSIPSGGQHLHAVISAADDWMDRSQEEIQTAVMADVVAACPEASSADIVQFRAIKERRATFRATPTAEAIRPHASPATGGTDQNIKNLYLAGDWCATGWPATMEGAVRSGYAAAAAITGQGGVEADASAGLLFRALSSS